MALGAILVLPIFACAFSMLPLCRRYCALITLIAMVIVLLLAISVALKAARVGELSVPGEWLTCDGLGALILLLVAFVGFTAALFSWGYIGVRITQIKGASVGRYYSLFNLFLLSMLAVPLLANVALMWIAVELTTLISAFLVGLEDTPEALEAAWKYVVLTTLGAVLALLGFLFLYWGARGAGFPTFTWLGLVTAAPHMPPALLYPAFLLILVGFGTKVGLVPLHTWLPDAHSQAPAPVCALLSGVETTTVLYVILRLFPVVSGVPGLNAKPWFVVFGLISVGIAALLLITVREFKRMFAFSTVEHMGIILTAAGFGGVNAHLGAAYQIMALSLGKSLCFFAAGVTVMAVGTQEIGSVRGLIRISPLSAAALLAGGFAIAGAPPFAVFVGEFTILKAAFLSGQYLAAGLLSVFIVIAFCAILYHINRMTFGSPAALKSTDNPISCKTTLVLATIPLLLFGLYIPAPLQVLLHAAAQAMGG